MTDHLLWLDLETTGTDETKDSIIEVGVIPTTTDLEVLGEWASYARPTDEALGRLMRNDEAHAMHEGNGLLAELYERDVDLPTIGAVDHQLDVWLRDVAQMHGVGRWVLAGSGVGHFDRRFIKAHMPKLDRALAHWCIDVGVIRRFFALATDTEPPEIAWGTDRRKPHRGLDDAYLHLAEAQAWRQYFRDAEDLFGEHT